MFIDKVQIVDEFERDDYLNDIPAISYIKKEPLNFNAPVTFFVGENGTGKSTLIEALAVASKFNPEGGTRNYNFATQNTHSELWERIRITKRNFPKWGYFLRAESFYNAASYLDKMLENQEYAGPWMHKQSHGESFLTILKENIGSKGLYILDEPEAALSPMRLLHLMALINSAIRNGSQFIIATHSPLLITFPASQLLYFSNSGIEEKPYYETEHYLISKRMLNYPQKIFDELFDDD